VTAVLGRIDVEPLIVIDRLVGVFRKLHDNGPQPQGASSTGQGVLQGRFVFNTTAMFLMCSSRCVLERLQSVRISTDEGLSRYKRNSSFFRRSSRTSAESSTITVLHSYIVRRLARWHRFARQFKLARITPEELRDKLNAGEDILIVDLHGGLDHHKHLLAIPGAVRIKNIGMWRYHPLRRSSSIVIVQVNLRAPASRWHCAGRVSSTFGRSPAAFGHGVTAAIPLPLKCGG
jgi:hypothetical protein